MTVPHKHSRHVTNISYQYILMCQCTIIAYMHRNAILIASINEIDLSIRCKCAYTYTHTNIDPCTHAHWYPYTYA